MTNESTQTITESKFDEFFWKGMWVFLAVYGLFVSLAVVAPAFAGEFARFF